MASKTEQCLARLEEKLDHVHKDVEQNSIMVGNPGRKIGNIDEKGNRNIFK